MAASSAAPGDESRAFWMRVLVTGAGGLLGSDLVRTLRDRCEVVGWARHAVPWRGTWSIPIDPVDLTDPASVTSSIQRWRPEAVIHSAAMTDVDASERDPELAMRVNRNGTRTVASACANVGAFLLAVSTDYVFDGRLNRPYREEDPPNPISHYGRSKRSGEEAALSGCPKTLIVRVSGLFGQSRDNFVRRTAVRLKAGETVWAVTDQVYSPSHTVDLAQGFRKLLEEYERKPGSAQPGGRLHGILHLSNTGGASRVEVAEWVAQCVGAPDSLIRRTTWVEMDRPAARPAQTALDCSRYVRISGAALRPWKESVRTFLETEGSEVHR